MTEYVVTGRPIGTAADEIGDAGVGTIINVKLTSEREAELVDAGVLQKATKADKAEAKADAQPDDKGSSGAKGT